MHIVPSESFASAFPRSGWLLVAGNLIPPSLAPLQSCRALRSGRNLARGERLLRTPGTRAYVTNAPRRGRGEGPATPAGVRLVVPLLPGVRFAHPRLSSSRPAGAE